MSACVCTHSSFLFFFHISYPQSLFYGTTLPYGWEKTYFCVKKIIRFEYGDGAGIHEPVENRDKIQLLIPVGYWQGNE
jgi:hypothetical protein